MIRLNDFQRLWQNVGTEVHHAVEHVGAGGWYILGSSVRQFEERLAAFFGVRRAVAVGSGHDALELALRAAGLEHGQRVLTTPLSAFATTQAIFRAGGEPVFVDVDAHGHIDLCLCRELLERHRDIRFLVPVHLFGHPLDLEELEELARTYELTVIEDCAQSAGALWGNRHTGSIGVAAGTSFYPTKNLGALGDGGAVLTDSDDLALRVARMRHGGRDDDGRHLELGSCSRLDELQAAILDRVMLEHLDTWIERRRQHTRFLSSAINHPSIRVHTGRSGGVSSCHLFPTIISGRGRDALRSHLRSQGIESAVHYPRLIPNEPALSGRGDVHMTGALDTASSWASNELSLPIHPFLTERELEHIAAACNAWEG